MDKHSELVFTKDVGYAKAQVELQAADTLGVLLKRVQVDFERVPTDVAGTLRKQASAIVERLNYIDTLKVIEVDGMSHAVQIRSAKPANEGFIEIILRAGRSISFERRGSPLHISRTQLDRLINDLTAAA